MTKSEADIEDEPTAAGKTRASGSAKAAPRLNYRTALQIIHAVLNPRSYVEIGCQSGKSLSLARCPSIAIDPEFNISQQLAAPTRIFRETSESFFKKYSLRRLIGGSFDLAFIDGLHHAEVALQDFNKLELNSSAASVIVIDDVLPEAIAWATRERQTTQWTGDIYKLPLLLRAERPDLSVEIFDVAEKGMAIVSRLDRSNGQLAKKYETLRAAILAGQYDLGSVEAIRQALKPRPVTDLVGHLADIAARRASSIKGWSKPGSNESDSAVTVGQPAAPVRELYLQSMMRILANTVYEDANINPRRHPQHDPALRAVGRDWPAQAFTMIGLERLDNLRRLATRTIEGGIPGDFIETGIWRGGACILMRAVLAAYNDRTRHVLCADSFRGLPPPDPERYPKDDAGKLHTYTQLAVSRPQVEEAFRRFDLLDEQVEFIEGMFRDSLPTLKGRPFALLRLDGDMYESTMVALENLYPSLSAGGYLIIDDYGAVPACKAAVMDFRASHAIEEPIEWIDWTGVWWQKRA